MHLLTIGVYVCYSHVTLSEHAQSFVPCIHVCQCTCALIDIWIVAAALITARVDSHCVCLRLLGVSHYCRLSLHALHPNLKLTVVLTGL